MRSADAALTAVDSHLAISFRALSDQVDSSFSQERLVAVLAGFFGLLSLMLAGLGLYGITSYAVTSRRAEFGIRMALGARGANVIGLVLRRSLAVTLLGLAGGLTAAVGATRFLRAMLFGLAPLDPTTFMLSASVLLAVSIVATVVPARWAAAIEPAVTLRGG